MSTRHPKTGERRVIRQRLKIDLFPQYVKDEITRLRAQWRSWEEIEVASRTFIKWDELDPAVAQLFPQKHLPHSNLHRWYDIRVEQRLAETLRRGEAARALADALVKHDFQDIDASVRNALGEQVFMLMQSISDDGQVDQAQFRKELLKLGLLLTEFHKAEARRRAADAVEKKLALMERDLDLKKKQVEKATDEVANKVGKGKEITLDDINRIRQRTFGLPPIQREPAASHPA